MIEQSVIQAAKSVDEHIILEHFGWKTYENGTRILCPNMWHHDTKPTVSVNKNNTCRCFSCGNTFDSILLYRRLAQKVDGNFMKFPDAVEKVLELGKANQINCNMNQLVNSSYQASVTSTTSSGKTPYDIALRYSRNLNKRELAYLHGRGIILYDSIVYQGNVFAITDVDNGILNASSIQDKIYWEEIKNQGTHYKGIFPILRQNRIQLRGNLYQGIDYLLYHINYDYSDDEDLQRNSIYLGNTEERHLIIKKSIDDSHIKQTLGPSDFVWIAEGITQGRAGDIYICEGMEDALSFTMHGYRSVSLNSVSNLNSFIEYLDKKYKPRPKERFVIAFDHDNAGEKGTNELISFFEAYNSKNKGNYFKQFHYGVCDYPKEYHDINDYWVARMFGGFTISNVS